MPRKAFLTLLLAASVGAASAASTKPAATLTFEQVVKRVAETQKKTRTLEANFQQDKVSSLLTQPETSKGTFLYSSPNKVLWVYQQPKPVTMLIADGFLTTYYPQLSRAERIEVKRFEDRIFRYMGATGAIDELAKYFHFRFVDPKREAFYRLELKPRTSIIARRVKGITIWIDRKTFITSKFEYIEADGDMTRYEFTDIKRNNPVAATRFTLKLPAGVKVEQMKVN